jgi:hypothetical protein
LSLTAANIKSTSVVEQVFEMILQSLQNLAKIFPSISLSPAVKDLNSSSKVQLIASEVSSLMT